jgi:uncharacterized protein (TIGR03435 family)
VGPMHFSGVRTEGSRLEGLTTVRGLVLWAYGLRNFQLTSETPDVFYDVQARAPGEGVPKPEEFRAMLRNLLAERFKLKVHTETRETPVYFLVVAKSGAKLKPGDEESTEPARVHVEGRNYELSMPQAKMQEFVQMLDNSGFMDRPAVDKTALEGRYKIELTYTPGFRADDPQNVDIFVALQRQLGLKLEQGKAPMQITVVDHAEKPAEN